MKHIELTRRAEKDLKQLDKPARTRIVEALRGQLTAEPPPENMDVKPLQGAEPWFRLRVGTYRVLFRPLTQAELRPLVQEHAPENRPADGYLVERIIHRRDLAKAAGAL